MGKQLIFVMTLAFVTSTTGLTTAGDYHSRVTLICSDCHTSHATQSHDYSGGRGSSWTPIPHLLKGDSICLGCHDESPNGPDVAGLNTGPWARQAGALNKLFGTETNYEIWKGHTLGSTRVPPGASGTWKPDATTGLTCTDCHSPHGDVEPGTTDIMGASLTSAYRNLRTGPGDKNWLGNVSYAVGTYDWNAARKDVFERNAALGDYATHYGVANVDFNNPLPGDSGIARWCGNCHWYFVGVEYVGTGPTGFIRHPTGNARIGWIGGSHSSAAVFYQPGKTNFVKVMSATGKWAPTNVGEVDGYPTCLTCHKAHGNQNAFGLIFMANTGAITEEGTARGTYRDLCKQCHPQD